MPISRTEPAVTGAAYSLVMQTARCWLGGLFSDAVEEKGDARDAGMRSRCFDVIQAVGGPASVSYYPLREVDAAAASRVAQSARTIASEDEHDAPYANDLVSLLTDIADASRENLRAGRAAVEVKSGDRYGRASDAGAVTKVAAVETLRQSSGLRRLLTHRGPYADEARAIALLIVLDRMEIARHLPTELALETLSGPLTDVFGRPAPTPIGDDASGPADPWLEWITDVAAAAGHPAPTEARDPRNREALSWTGILLGVTDRLRPLVGGVGAELDPAVRGAVRQLEEEGMTVRASYDRLPSAKR